MQKKITFALTSCGRPDLLEITLDSFLKYNTYPIDRFKIIDDSKQPELFTLLVEKYPQIEWIFNTERLGQSASIDILYNDIDTEYIFHCEDDWEFLKSGFIEESLEYMELSPNTLQAWLRGPHDTNGHPLIIANKYDLLTRGYQGIWHGFSLNPGLRRLKEYLMAKPYSSIGWETELNKFYYERGYYAISLKTKYVKHIGWTRHIQDAKG